MLINFCLSIEKYHLNYGHKTVLCLLHIIVKFLGNRKLSSFILCKLYTFFYEI